MCSPGEGIDLASLLARRADAHRAVLEDARGPSRVDSAALHDLAERWARALDDHAPGASRVLVDVDDPVRAAVALVGLVAAGRCAVPVDPGAPEGERRRHAATTRPDLVVGDRPDRPDLPGIPTWLVDDDGAPPATPAPVGGRPAARGGAILLLTSGSTGEPKAVRLDEARLLHVAHAVAEHLGLRPGDRGYNPLPLWHVNAEVVAVLSAVVSGATAVLDRRFHREGFWKLVTDLDVTWINAVPAILGILADGGGTGEGAAPRPPRLRAVRSASAPLPRAVRARIVEELGVPLVESFGMTEAASQITATPLDEAAPEGSCGRPTGVSLEIRDDDGRPVGPGVVGRIWIAGPAVIAGYEDGRAADRFDDRGWLDTGDLGHLDAAGFLFHVGRRDDAINRGGEMLQPREIEEVLLAEPGVSEAAVVGAPDEVLGQRPVAFVVPGDGQVLERGAAADDLRGRLAVRCRDELGRAKRPAAVFLVDALPRAATGKVQRHRLVVPESF